jgi:hypothetical protein
MSLEVVPVQYDVRVGCGACKIEATIVILWVGDEPLREDNVPGAYMVTWRSNSYDHPMSSMRTAFEIIYILVEKQGQRLKQKAQG